MIHGFSPVFHTPSASPRHPSQSVLFGNKTTTIDSIHFSAKTDSPALTDEEALKVVQLLVFHDPINNHYGCSAEQQTQFVQFLNSTRKDSRVISKEQRQQVKAILNSEDSEGIKRFKLLNTIPLNGIRHLYSLAKNDDWREPEAELFYYLKDEKLIPSLDALGREIAAQRPGLPRINLPTMAHVLRNIFVMNPTTGQLQQFVMNRRPLFEQLKEKTLQYDSHTNLLLDDAKTIAVAILDHVLKGNIPEFRVQGFYFALPEQQASN